MRSRLLAAAFASALIGPAMAADSVRGVTDNEIVIGTYTDLSGVTAMWGVNNTNAWRMVFDETNAAGGINGRKIKYIVEDNQYQIPRSIQAANKLINRDNVFMMVANGGTPMNNATMPDQLAKGVPNVFPLTSARSMYEPLHHLKFGLAASYYDQMRSGVKVFIEQHHNKAVCAMSQDTDFGRDVMAGAKDQLAAMNLKLVAETLHKPTDTDFSASVARLKEANCDLILLGTITRDTIQIVSSVRKIGWNVEMLGQAASYDEAVAEVPGGVTEGLLLDDAGAVRRGQRFEPGGDQVRRDLQEAVRQGAELRRAAWLHGGAACRAGAAEGGQGADHRQLRRRHGEHQGLARHLRLAGDELQRDQASGLQRIVPVRGEERPLGAGQHDAGRLLSRQQDHSVFPDRPVFAPAGRRPGKEGRTAISERRRIARESRHNSARE